MTMLSDDLAAIFADTSVTVPVAFGSSPVQTTRGHFTTEDIPEPDGAGGIVLASRQMVTIVNGSLSGIVSNAAITVDGVAYRIHSVRAHGRGKTRVVLA